MVVGVVVGVLVFAIAAAGFAGWRAVSGGDDSGAAPTPATPASAVPSSTPDATTTTPPDGSDPKLAPFYRQKLAWRACGRDQCTLLKVPLDYDHPSGKVIQLAVLKVPAASRSARVGSLVVNPGVRVARGSATRPRVRCSSVRRSPAASTSSASTLAAWARATR